MISVPCIRLLLRLLMILIAVSVLDISIYAGSIQQDDIIVMLIEQSSEQSEDTTRSLQNPDVEQDEEFTPFSIHELLHQGMSRQKVIADDHPDVREFIRHEGEPPENS